MTLVSAWLTADNRNMLKIPFVDLKSQYLSIKEEIDPAVRKVIERSSFIGGQDLKDFESAFAHYLGVRHCIGVGNGTDALTIALICSGLQPGDEVITAANTFIATAEAITNAGGQVVFADCAKDTYNIDPLMIEAAITLKTRAIIPVHLYGQPCALKEISALADRHGLILIEDACQAHGAEYQGKKAGSFGRLAAFSFFPGKNLGAYGDGGALVTDDDRLAEKARMYANHGRAEKYDHRFEGVNSRLDSLQAAILSVKLRHLDRWNDNRRKIARVYFEKLKTWTVLPRLAPESTHVFHLFVVRVKQRSLIRDILAQKGIATGIHYPTPLPFLQAYSRLGHVPDDFPAAFSLKDEILSLPIHGEMTEEQAVYVAEALISAIQSSREQRAE